MLLKAIHHIAVIASDYPKSRHFYCQILGFSLISEVYREERQSWKADLALNGRYTIELFSFPSPPARPGYPEACGLRHLAFAVDDLEQVIAHLAEHDIACEAIRVDPYTGNGLHFLPIRTDFL